MADRTTGGISGSGGANVNKVYRASNLDVNSPLVPGTFINGTDQRTERQKRDYENAKAAKQKAELERRKNNAQKAKEAKTIKGIVAQENAAKGIK